MKNPLLFLAFKIQKSQIYDFKGLPLIDANTTHGIFGYAKVSMKLSILLFLFFVNTTVVKAQFGSDLGQRTVSTLAWEEISSCGESGGYPSASIGLTTDRKMYVWGSNTNFVIHTERSDLNNLPKWQLTPYYLPSPTGETIKKVRVNASDAGTTLVNSFFCLSESGKLYGWGINDGLFGSAWTNVGIASNLSPGDTTYAARKPVQLTILGESSFVDFDVCRKGNYWIAISASGKAYHIGIIGTAAILDNTTVSQSFAALPNPAGVSATFKYTNVWVNPNNVTPIVYLKGNDDKIYYTGLMNNISAFGSPTVYDATTFTTAQSQAQIRSLVPVEIPFPAGENIESIKMSPLATSQAVSTFAISASGKAFITGLWRFRKGTLSGIDTYVVAPLKSNPIVGTEVDPVGVSTTDSSYYLKKFVEVALPPGATKILDITSYVSTETHSSLVVGDNNRVYWSGSTQASSPAYISIGNYLSVSNSLGAGAAGSQDCRQVVQVQKNSYFSWPVEAINFEGAAEIEYINQSCSLLRIISKSRRGYFAGELFACSGTGKINIVALNSTPRESVFPVPIANELLADCNPSPGVGGPLVAISAPTNTAVGTIDCSKTQLSPAPTVGTATQLDLIVSINVTTAGTFTPITVSGSGMTLANDISSVTTTTTGVQTFHIPMKYDGTALGTLNFQIGTLTACTANLTLAPKSVVCPIWTLDNCSPVQVGPVLK